MRASLLIAAAVMSVTTGSVERCHVCKTANALELFANLHCDTVPDTAPDCSLTTRGRGSDFFQHCPEHSNCLTITKKEEELRVCTSKRRVEVMKTTDGIVMEVCNSNMCNSAALPVVQLSMVMLPALATLLAGRAV